jgi:hypothetical protein
MNPQGDPGECARIQWGLRAETEGPNKGKCVPYPYKTPLKTPQFTKYSCFSDGECRLAENGTYTNQQTCETNCKEICYQSDPTKSCVNYENLGYTCNADKTSCAGLTKDITGGEPDDCCNSYRGFIVQDGKCVVGSD